MFDVQMYKDLSMYDYAMDVYQKTMHKVIDHLQFILDTDNA